MIRPRFQDLRGGITTGRLGTVITVSPNRPSTPHHQRIANIDDDTTQLKVNWCFEPKATDLPMSLTRQLEEAILVSSGPFLPFVSVRDVAIQYLKAVIYAHMFRVAKEDILQKVGPVS
jgi:hypothetical protein